MNDARRKLEQAQQSLAEARDDDPRVESIYRRLRELQHANRFAALINDALKGAR